MKSVHNGKATGVREQWACKVLSCSSQYDSKGWAATAALGPPKVYPQYGDIEGAWAQNKTDCSQFIELGFETDVYISAIKIYETFNCGAVKGISVQSPSGIWDSVWETNQVEHKEESRIFTPVITTPDYRTKAVRLDIDCTACKSWVEIDAVQLVGRRIKVDLPPPVSNLTDDLSESVNCKKSSDVMFRIHGTDIFAHRAILSVRSQKLGDMMDGVGQDIPILIEDIDPRAFLGVLHYIYSSNLPAEFDAVSLVDVWRAAAKFEIAGLRAFCVTAIDERVNINNVIAVFVKASDIKPASEEIREVCLEYMASNLGAVSLSSGFKELSPDQKVDIIELSAARMSL